MKRRFFFIKAAIACALISILGTVVSATNLPQSIKTNKRTVSIQKPILKFHKDGTFKIAQFTDPHWKVDRDCTPGIETVRYVLHTEQPDVAILTGDVILDIKEVEKEETKKLWKQIIRVFEEEKMPFAVVLGNHDSENNITRDEIFDLLIVSPYFVGEKGPKEISGVGNYVLPVRESNSDRVASLLYCMDSNDYHANQSFSHYDSFHYDQIAWYREQSKKFTAANNNQALPALAFFHIPLLEYNHVIGKAKTIGRFNEAICPGNINTGMFASFVEMGDVMGTFCGHDHTNDFIGIDCGIALAYGRCAFGVVRGGRIIKLQENKRLFNTWIRTEKERTDLYLYPAGTAGVDEY
jgi:predicted MPP superfamily phosphohydrolase